MPGNSTIRSQIFTALAILGATAIAADAIYDSSRLRGQVESDARRSSKASVETSARHIERLLELRDLAEARLVVTAMSDLPDLAEATLVDESGRVVASSLPADQGRDLAARPTESGNDPGAKARREGVTALAMDANALVVAAPVGIPALEDLRVVGPSPAPAGRGLLIARFDLGPRIAAAQRGLLVQVAVVAAVVLGAILLLGWLLERSLVRRAQRLGETVERFVQGDRQARTSFGKSDDLGRVGAALDQMAASAQATEDDLRRTSNLLDAILAALPLGLVVVRREDGRLLYANPQWLSNGPAELDASTDILTVMQGVRYERSDGSEYVFDDLTIPTALRTGRPAHLDDLVVRRPDGTSVPVIATAVPVSLTGETGFDAVIGLVQDRKALARAFDELKKWETRFDLVVRATGQVFYDRDLLNGDIRWSGSIQGVFGHSPEAFGAGFERWKSLVHPEDLHERLTELQTCQDERRLFDAEYRFRHADGRWLTVRDRGLFLYDHTGRPAHMVGTMADVTAQRAMEDQLRQTQKLQTVGTLAGGIAHDFNNQLTGVIAHLDLLGRELPPGDPRLDHVDLARAAAERCADLTRSLLAFGRRLPGEPRPTSLNPLIQTVVERLRATLPENIAVELELADGLWPVRVDPDQIRQVVSSLCLNARDAMASGGTLRVWTENAVFDSRTVESHPGSRPGAFVKLGISDSGVGISTDALKRIFEPFFTTKPIGSSSGMSLAAVHGIVSGHRGWVEVTSRPGEGATFVVHLPRAAESASAAETEAPIESLGRDARPSGIPGGSSRPSRDVAASAAGAEEPKAGETILVVDDEPGIREVASRTLRGAGYQVLTAADGDEALRLYRERGREVAAVVLDLMMPGKTGLEVLRELLAIDPRAQVILSSGYTPQTPSLATSGLGSAFLAKPYGHDRLLTTIRSVLDARRVPA